MAGGGNRGNYCTLSGSAPSTLSFLPGLGNNQSPPRSDLSNEATVCHSISFSTNSYPPALPPIKYIWSDTE